MVRHLDGSSHMHGFFVLLRAHHPYTVTLEYRVTA